MKTVTIVVIVVVIIILIAFAMKSTSTPAEAPTLEVPAATAPAAEPAAPAAAAPAATEPAQAPSAPATSGLQMQDIKVGTGAEAKAGDMVTVQYTGTLTNGTKFDSSYDRPGQPFRFALGAGMVIKGWDLGVAGMKEGGKRHLVIPADLAYGAASPSPLIPANSTLVFDVELLKVERQ